MLSTQDCIRSCFAADTAIYPDKWTTDKPSTGHCLVASLLFQEIVGGKILVGKVNRGTVHYWNLVDGHTVDLTRDQFDEFTLRGNIQFVDRVAKLKNKDTRDRLDRLRHRFNQTSS